jgi:hypothetical protein
LLTAYVVWFCLELASHVPGGELRLGKIAVAVVVAVVTAALGLASGRASSPGRARRRPGRRGEV